MANIEKLGSSSPEVLLKNATNLDQLVNGRESESLPDRFGVLRKTWHGMEMIFSRFITYITGRGEQAVASIGWQELGNWATGLTVDNRQQIVYYNGSWYKYLGELEHVIAGDSPENDGGVWSAENPTGKWSNIGDAALRSNLGSGEGTSLVAKLGNKPLVAISYYKNQGLSDQDAVQAAFDESSNITFDANVTLTSAIEFDRSEPCTVIFSPGITVTNTNFLPRLTTHPNHKISGTTFRTKQYSAVNIDGTSVKHQTMAVEMAVHDTLSSGPNYEPFVALMAAIESFNCERQKLWGMNILTNAHNLKAGDEVYGIEVDTNVDGVLDGAGNYCGVYIAGAGDLSGSSGSDGVRVQRLRDGVAKWQYGQRIFDSVTGLGIYDASNYSIFASGNAPIARRRDTQSGVWSFIHSVSASVIPWGVDDYGDTYSRRLYLGTGNGKAKNRVNLDGGVKFHTTSSAVAWGPISAGGYSEKDVTTLFGISIADWTNYTLDVTPVGYAGSMPVVAVQVYINSAKTQAYVRIINISGSALSACNVGLNAKLCGHSSTN
ncbi:TPA: hypothetical protein R1Q20_001514 [Klebsiella pneumoniae]|uniref:hypothetical protein n=5 Tax=Klebsiella pneumoniae TaxID=573 RepID=UPI001CD21E71|nr:hypothetical protein [Klebsiella pneumoniae]MCK9806974.1 hypothetical protein [Klebsiella pneumoniae]MCO0742248.1 hypothetical protein [Klebsiella pneumoniae]MDC6503819.1 hypothetical protein [Klebsiella pneumoniae]MDC6519851.1 hypothetical protein [Klebsiella pneumoniae]MDZ6076274.1 hypothetical protein [Klebsiella pneumoniae]